MISPTVLNTPHGTEHPHGTAHTLYRVVQQNCNLESQGENCDGTDFKIEVAAALPELSEWTLRVIENSIGIWFS